MNIRLKLRRSFLTVRHHRIQLLSVYFRRGIVVLLHTFCYIILALLALWYVYRWDDVRVKRKKQQAVIEKDKELHDMEREYEEEKARQEKQIMQLEKKNWNTICNIRVRKWPI